MPNTKVAWVEGSAPAAELVFDLADKIVGATLPDGVVNNWTEEYRSVQNKWVTYEPVTKAAVVATYLHTDGKSYPVYVMSDLSQLKKPTAGTPSLVDAEGYVHEVTASNANVQTGKKMLVTSLDYTDPDSFETVTRPIFGCLVVNVDDPTTPTHKAAYVVKQGYLKDDVFTEHAGWPEFRIAAPMPGDLDFFLAKAPSAYRLLSYYNYGGGTVNTVFAAAYKYTQLSYKANTTFNADLTVVLKSETTPPLGYDPKEFFVMLKTPAAQFNYFDVYYGEQFTVVPAIGDSTETYALACNVSTVLVNKVPIIINQKEAHLAYLRWNDTESPDSNFVPADIKWITDYDGVNQVISPPAHFFFGADSVVTWLTNKKRRPDYRVNYWLSVNNGRVALVLEGDPSPDIDGYYRSFGYIGRIIPFDDHDYLGNFGVTVGMGDPTVPKTGFTAASIRVDQNPTVYATFGSNTSNGMYSQSMMRTANRVPYQAYFPAFVTQLPGYTGVGTIPSELSKLIRDKTKNFFQASNWTDRYHASPIYLVHTNEGYRGYLDGVIVINDFNLINKDELIVDTGELKNILQPELGTWTEVYKFFSVTSPVNFLKFSPNPDDCSIAILKEIR